MFDLLLSQMRHVILFFLVVYFVLLRIGSTGVLLLIDHLIAVVVVKLALLGVRLLILMLELLSHVAHLLNHVENAILASNTNALVAIG